MPLVMWKDVPLELDQPTPQQVATPRYQLTNADVQRFSPSFNPSSTGPRPGDMVLGGNRGYSQAPSAVISGNGAPRSPIGPGSLSAAANGVAAGPLEKLAGPLSFLPQTLDSLGRAAESAIDTGSAWRDFIAAKGNEDKYLANRLRRLTADPKQAMTPNELEAVKNRLRQRNPNAVPPWVVPIDPTSTGNLEGYGNAGGLYNVYVQVNAYNYDPFGGERRSSYEGIALGGPFQGPILGMRMEPDAETQKTSSGTGIALLTHGNPPQEVGVGSFDFNSNSRREATTIGRVLNLDGQEVQGNEAQSQNAPSIPSNFNQSPSLLSPIPANFNPQQLQQSPTLQPQKQGTKQPQNLQQPQKLNQTQGLKQPQQLKQPQNYIPQQLTPNLPLNYQSKTTPSTSPFPSVNINLQDLGGKGLTPKNYQNVGNPLQQQQQQQQPLRPSTPPRCEDPCIASLQQGQDAASDLLNGIQDLLDGFFGVFQQYQEGQQQQQQQNALIAITVPVVTCNLDGTAETESGTLLVPSAMASAIREQFLNLAAIQTIQCKLERNTERALNILGGDEWFEDEEDREPEFETKVERKIKEAGTLFGFPAIAAEETPTGGTGGDGANQPVAGQLKAKNLIELINAYTSNLYHRAGYQGLPATVPKTLLGYTDGAEPESIKDFASYFVWFVKQVDALIGKFPINITIEDVDPLTQGNQTKQIELPNISEALAEMYGVNISSSVNADVAVNFLMRLSSEMIATKNSSLITQDYVRANAAFLGYKGNAARREVNYSFNPAKLDSLDEFLKESKGYLVGWEEDDSESVVGFLQRIVFSAGIIKSVFFRDKKRLAELQKELENMIEGDKAASDADWEAILKLFNDPLDYFNKDSIPHPRVREKPAPPPPEEPT